MKLNYVLNKALLDSKVVTSHRLVQYYFKKGVRTLRSCSYCAASDGSMAISGGARAGISTNSKLGSPISFRASHRNGFSKL